MTTIILLLFVSSVSMYMYFLLQTNKAVARFKNGARNYLVEFNLIKRKLYRRSEESSTYINSPININDFKPVIKPITRSSISF